MEPKIHSFSTKTVSTFLQKLLIELQKLFDKLQKLFDKLQKLLDKLQKKLLIEFQNAKFARRITNFNFRPTKFRE